MSRAAQASSLLQDSGTARLIVTVRDTRSDQPLSYARVRLMTRTDSVPGYGQAAGLWRFESERGDSAQFWVQALGYARATGVVSLRRGVEDTLTVFLPPSSCGLEIDRVP